MTYACLETTSLRLVTQCPNLTCHQTLLRVPSCPSWINLFLGAFVDENSENKKATEVTDGTRSGRQDGDRRKAAATLSASRSSSAVSESKCLGPGASRESVARFPIRSASAPASR